MKENNNEEIWHLSNTLLNDGQLSFRARGLFLYIVFSNEKKGLTLEMIKKASTDSERMIKMGVNELEKNGYIIRNMLKNGEIRWTYNLKRNISEETEVIAKTSDVVQQSKKKKPQGRKKTRRLKTTKKTFGSFFKEFF
jgi:DNA-binding HxlR family transcriptional regulator